MIVPLWLSVYASLLLCKIVEEGMLKSESKTKAKDNEPNGQSLRSAESLSLTESERCFAGSMARSSA